MTKQIFDKYVNWLEPFEDTQDRKIKITPYNKGFEPDQLPEKMDVVLKTINIQKILDFGAGLCRNLSLLRTYAKNVDYLDLECYRQHTQNIDYNDKFYTNLVPENVNKKYDLIYASVVLQHIVDMETLAKIIAFMGENGKYLLTVQNHSALQFDTCGKFKLIYSESYKGVFAEKHLYTLYASNCFTKTI